MSKENNELAIPMPEDGGFQILAMDDAASMLVEAQPTLTDLAKLVVPSGTSGAFFSIETLEGEEAVKELEVIIPWQSKTERSFYGTEVGHEDPGPPHCSSSDGRVGYGVRNLEVIQDGRVDDVESTEQECGSCPWSQFGSALNGGAGQACKQRVRLGVFQSQGVLPMVAQVPAASLKEWKHYQLRLLNNLKRPSDVVTRLSLDKRKGSTDYFAMVFQYVRDLTPAERERSASLNAAFVTS